ncbi:MAG: hypothetical protein PSY12_04725 [bacterium]|nr:hypothetical protein [bacterium]
MGLLALSVFALVGARPPLRFQPDPSSVIAAEIAFNRLAQAKGQWTAFRETAADDAVLFKPQRVLAAQWLKGRADPAVSIRWSPSIVYVACGGDLAASTGNWQGADGAVGYFTTLWRRDKKGRWQWIMDHGDTLATARAAPEFLIGKVATCKTDGRADAPPPPLPAGQKRGKGDMPPAPRDESLIWSADVAPDGSRRVAVQMWDGTAYQTVIDDKVGAPTA